MDYNQTLEFLFSQLPMFQRIGAAAYKASLDNTIALAELTGNPEQRLKTIHIAGTNGKGSVSSMIASIMQENGYKTGLFTSPHLSDFRERIKINGEMIDKEYIVNFVEQYTGLFQNIKPSFFEWTFALAMKWFHDNQTDIAIIETGMGGRLDSTNIINPLLSVITNIGMDHTAFLGDTVPAIAREKAGIIKQGIPVVIGQSHAETDPVFLEVSKQHAAAIMFADKNFKTEISEHQLHTECMNVKVYESGISKTICCPLTGEYQLKNIATVMAAMRVLTKNYKEFGSLCIGEGIRNTIKNTGLKGRWQTIGQNPLIICDIGHNPDGIKEVVMQIKKTPYKNLHIVLGVVNDKDVKTMLMLLPANAVYYFCKADIPRGLDAIELQNTANDFGLKGDVYPSVKSALENARAMALPEDLVFVGGSAFVVAEVV